MDFQNSSEFALYQDEVDPLKEFRGKFHIPQKDGKEVLYFTGNSLGLQPHSAKTYINEELEDWKNLGVEGHFEGRRPWFSYHKFTKKYLSNLLGAHEQEIVSANQLTTNLHLLFVSFYRPTKERFKVIMESGAFPSDMYMVETQVRLHGLDPNEAIVEISPDIGELISHNHILDTIEAHKDELALVFLSGVQYYSGQLFDLREITKKAHDVGAMAGFDLAHAVGNIPLSLHDDNVDFASWCSYKYLNSGPGNVSGLFVHSRHGKNPNLFRFGGWWGHDEGERFKMEKGFKPMAGADGWQLSNVNVLSTAAHLASLEIFEEAGMNTLREKSIKLTGFLEYIINITAAEIVKIITPTDSTSRGCQLSLVVQNERGKEIHEFLTDHGVVVDWREPNVIRIAPVPLYNSFKDVFEFGKYLKKSIE